MRALKFIAVLILTLAIGTLVCVGFTELSGCSPRAESAAAVAAQSATLGVAASKCRRKGNALLIEAGTCQEKRARLETLIGTDPDCEGIYEDAGTGITCQGDTR